ncbi:ArsR/SmtB family transcription factor [Streptomyces sp. NPDC002537]
MLELSFGVADMARVRFGVSPIDQVISGVAGAEHHCVGESVNRDRWWRQARRHVPRQAAPVFDLVNASFEGVPDFLFPHGEDGCRRLVDELDAMLAVPETVFHESLAFYGREPGLPRIVEELRDGGTRGLRRIADGVWAMFQACFAPDWPDIQRLLQADVAHHARTAAEAGTGAMLAGLHPQLAWRDDGVLQCATPEWDAAFDLRGRGLELHPNVFLQGVTAGLAEHRPPMMMYPVGARPPEHTPTHRTDGLANLIGPARARALRAIGQSPCTTMQLAERLGVTSPSASAHATALRTAGVITTEREGRQVRHALTPLGHGLLFSNPVFGDPMAGEPAMSVSSPGHPGS